MKTLKSILVVTFILFGTVELGAADFIRGDVNQDGHPDVADAIKMLSFLFTGASLTCLDAADLNDDGKTDLGDPIFLLSYLFSGSKPPAPPFPGCGSDATADSIGCDSFNTDICPDMKLRIDSISPDSGPPEGGTFVTITGEGFSGSGLQASLCSRKLINVQVVTDKIIQAETPPGNVGETCSLNMSNVYGQASVSNAFNYFLPPPECMSEDDLQSTIGSYVGQPVCLESPAWEGTITGVGDVVVCPEGSGTCGDPEVNGCEITIGDINTTINFETSTASAAFAGSSSLPILINTTTCQTDFDYTGSSSLDFTLSPTQWDGIAEITAIDNMVLNIDTLDLDSSGGFVCLLLPLSSDLLKDTMQDELNNYSDQFLEELRAELVGQYVCTQGH